MHSGIDDGSEVVQLQLLLLSEDDRLWQLQLGLLMGNLLLWWWLLIGNLLLWWWLLRANLLLWWLLRANLLWWRLAAALRCA